MRYSIDIPYPEIKVEKKDIELAKKILNLYAGEISEDTAIHNYTFQMMIMHANEERKKILKEVAITEMHHLEILGLLIEKLGLTPFFVGVQNGTTKWWNGEFVTYEKEWKKMLLDNIGLEELAIQNYEKIIEETEDENVKYILKRIILDERLHIEIFSKLYQEEK